MLKWRSFPKALQANVKNAFIIHGPIPFTFRNTKELIYHAWIQHMWAMRSTGFSLVKKDNSITTDAKVCETAGLKGCIQAFSPKLRGIHIYSGFFFQKAIFIDILRIQKNGNSHTHTQKKWYSRKRLLPLYVWNTTRDFVYL